MTRKKWSDLRDSYLKTPEQRVRYAKARTELEADLTEFEVLLSPLLDLDVGLVDIKERRERLEDKHPEWFEDR